MTARSRTTLSDVVDPRDNGLNFVRLVLATSVIVWHAFPLSGRAFPAPALAQILGQFSVDGFFAISGFLLAGSWRRRPAVVPYLRNRALRLLPAFWACLVLVALVFAPLGQLLRGAGVGAVFVGPHNAWHYIGANAALWMRFYDVSGGPDAAGLAGVWNGSLWTLRWEAFAYLALLALGVAGLLRRRWVPGLVAGAFWVLSVALVTDVLPSGYWTTNGVRLGLMFALGMALEAGAHRIPAGREVVVGAVLLLVVSPVLDDYRILGGPALAFLVLRAGGAIRRRSWQLRDFDLSYGVYIYAFPVQQLLVLGGAATWPVALFAGASMALTAPLAAASWVLVEQPSLALKGRRRPPPDPDPSRPQEDAQPA